MMTLNTGSSIPASFMNPIFVYNIKTTDHPLMMSTNTGTKTMNLQGNVKGLGCIWFDPNQIADIFGFSNQADNHRITYNSAIEDAFNVHIYNRIIKFECTKDGLYIYCPPAKFNAANTAKKNMMPPPAINPDATSLMVTTGSENRKGFTQHQIDQAKQAQCLYHIVGSPTVDNFKAII